MRAPYLAIVAAALGAGLAACSGGGGSPSTPIRPVAAPTATPTAASSSTSLSSSFIYDSSFVHAATLTGPAKFGALGIDVALRMSNPQGLMSYAAAVSKPGSSVYRHFLTPTQIADRFGASAADQAAAIAYFHKYGLWVSGWKQRMLLHVFGPQSKLEAAFHTTFGTYRNPKTGETFWAPETQPELASGVPVIGSANIVFRTKRYTRQFVPAKGVGTGYSPQQVAAAFDYTGAYNAGYTGSGVTIGIIGTGPIVTTTGSTIGDADAYRLLFNVAGSSTVTEVATTGSDPVVNGSSGFASPPPVAISGCNATQTNPADNESASVSPYTNCNPEDIEAQLDTEQTAMLARDSTVQFYLAYNPNDDCSATVGNASPCPAGDGTPQQGLSEYEEEFQTIIDHDTADVVSGSFGGSEFSSEGETSPPAPFTSDGSGLDPTELAMMVSEGMAVFISSGDQGAEGCQGTGPQQEVDSLCVDFPASDPDVTGVGGVTTPLNAAGQFAGPVTAWGVQTSGGQGGTGGGVSAYFTQPEYQLDLPGIIGSARNVPDLALEADNSTGVAVLAYAAKSFGGAYLSPVGGTSVAAPEMAAMWALVLQACKQSAACTSGGSGSTPYRLGNPDPLIYKIYQNASTYGQTFLPVVYGDNAQIQFCYQTDSCPTSSPSTPPLDPGYTATAGYNRLTGLGVPFARSLIKAIVGV